MAGQETGDEAELRVRAPAGGHGGGRTRTQRGRVGRASLRKSSTGVVRSDSAPVDSPAPARSVMAPSRMAVLHILRSLRRAYLYHHPVHYRACVQCLPVSLLDLHLYDSLRWIRYEPRGVRCYDLLLPLLQPCTQDTLQIQVHAPPNSKLFFSHFQLLHVKQGFMYVVDTRICRCMPAARGSERFI